MTLPIDAAPLDQRSSELRFAMRRLGRAWRLLLGEEVDILEHCQAISTLVRLVQRIGLRRAARDIKPSVQDYLTNRIAAIKGDVDAEPVE